MTQGAAAATALVPVVAFLGLLLMLDSFKLVALRSLITAMGAGALAALACLPVNAALVVTTPAPYFASRYVAPLLEETLKAAAVALLVWRGGAGFLVDAAILGFAIGTGFALVENVHYLWALPDGGVLLSFVRGFGTAILHGATTAIVAMAAQHLMERRERRRAVDLFPGWAAAVAVHSAFNHFVLPPVAATLLLLIALPPLLIAVFERSERATRAWVQGGMDDDLGALRELLSADFAGSPAGRYLRALRSRFPGPVVADMFCLLRLDLELGIRARAMLMARDAGVALPADDGLAAQLAEHRYLKRSIGRTGLLALRPLQPAAPRRGWQAVLLGRHAAPSDVRH